MLYLLYSSALSSPASYLASITEHCLDSVLNCYGLRYFLFRRDETLMSSGSIWSELDDRLVGYGDNMCSSEGALFA